MVALTGEEPGVSMLPENIWHADWEQPGIEPPTLKVLQALQAKLNPYEPLMQVYVFQ